jgi:hypothetical protein
MNALLGDAETVLYTVGLVAVLIFRQEVICLIGLLRSRLARKTCTKAPCTKATSKLETGRTAPEKRTTFDESNYDSAPPKSQPFPCYEPPSHSIASDESTAQTEDNLELDGSCATTDSPSSRESISSAIQRVMKSTETSVHHRRPPSRPSLQRKVSLRNESMRNVSMRNVSMRNVSLRNVNTTRASALSLRVKSRLLRQSLVRSKSMEFVMEDDTIAPPVPREASMAGSAPAPSFLHTDPTRSPVRSPVQRSRSGDSMQGSTGRSPVQRSRSGDSSMQGSTGGSPVQRSRSGDSMQGSTGGSTVQQSRSGDSMQGSTGGSTVQEPRMNRRMSTSDQRMLMRIRTSQTTLD